MAALALDCPCHLCAAAALAVGIFAASWLFLMDVASVVGDLEALAREKTGCSNPESLGVPGETW